MLNNLIGHQEEVQLEINKLDERLNALHDAIEIHGEDATLADLPEGLAIDLEDLGWDTTVSLGTQFKMDKMEEDECYDRYNAVANILDPIHW